MWEIYKRILKISLKDNCLFKAKVIQSIVGIININRTKMSDNSTKEREKRKYGVARFLRYR